MDKMQILSFVVDLFSENDSVLLICGGKVKVCEGLAVDLKMNLLSDVFFYSVGLQSGVSNPRFFPCRS